MIPVTSSAHHSDGLELLIMEISYFPKGNRTLQNAEISDVEKTILINLYIFFSWITVTIEHLCFRFKCFTGYSQLTLQSNTTKFMNFVQAKVR